MPKEMSDNARLMIAGSAAVAILLAGLAISAQQSQTNTPPLTATAANEDFLSAFNKGGDVASPPEAATKTPSTSVAPSKTPKPESKPAIRPTQPLVVQTVSYLKPVTPPTITTEVSPPPPANVSNSERPEEITPEQTEPEQVETEEKAPELEEPKDAEPQSETDIADNPSAKSEPSIVESTESAGDEIEELADTPETSEVAASDSQQASPQDSVPPAAALESSDTSTTQVLTRPFLGITLENVSHNLIASLHPGSTASKLGIESGDRILSLNDQAVDNLSTLRSALASMTVGSMVKVRVSRVNDVVTLGPQALGARPMK